MGRFDFFNPNFFSVNAGVLAETRPPATSSGNRDKDQLSDLQKRYDEQLKALENRVSLLTQKDDEIKTLVQALVSATKSTDPNVSIQAVGVAATHAITSATEAVKHLESFYATAGTQLGIILTALALVGGWLGITQFKGVAKKLLDKEIEQFNKQVQQLTVNHQEIVSKYSETMVATANLTRQLEKEARAITKLRENIETNARNIELIKGMTFEEAEAMAHFIVGIGQLTVAEMREVANQKELSKRHVQFAERYLSRAERFWEKPEMREKTDAVNTLAYIWANLAYAKKRLGNNQGALDLIEKAIKYTPNIAPYLFNGGCYAALCSFRAKSLEYFTRAIIADPNFKIELIRELSEKGDAGVYADDAEFKALLENK